MSHILISARPATGRSLRIAIASALIALMLSAAGTATTTMTSDALSTCGGATWLRDGRIYVPTVSNGSITVRCQLREGNKGNGVRALQLALKECHRQTLAVDGIFGPQTKRALQAVQRNARITADGIYGNQTRGVLRFYDWCYTIS